MLDTVALGVKVPYYYLSIIIITPLKSLVIIRNVLHRGHIGLTN